MSENITKYRLKIQHECSRRDFSVNLKAKCAILLYILLVIKMFAMFFKERNDYSRMVFFYYYSDG